MIAVGGPLDGEWIEAVPGVAFRAAKFLPPQTGEIVPTEYKAAEFGTPDVGVVFVAIPLGQSLYDTMRLLTSRYRVANGPVI